MLANRSVVSVDDITTDEMNEIFRLSTEMQESLERGKKITTMQGKVMSTLFFEPSTRTRMSFEGAMHRLGGSVLTMADSKSSSATKGETLSDSIRVISSYSDIIVIRHPMEGAARLSAKFSSVPVINGGDGSGQHPTQTLLDLYTVFREFSSLSGLTITLLGDLKYGRTVHSLLLALARYDVKVNLVSPGILRIPDHILGRISGKIDVLETEKLDDALADSDVIYVTRIQKERFADMNEYKGVIGSYSIDQKMLAQMKERAIIMHPLPRVDEIKAEVDTDKRARYFKQAANGIPVRMALISKILEE